MAGLISPLLETYDGETITQKVASDVETISQTLDPGEAVSSEWVQTEGFVEVGAFVIADEPSADDGVTFEFTTKGDSTPTADTTQTYTYTPTDASKGFRTFTTSAALRQVRVTYTNGATTTDFQATVILSTFPSGSTASYVGQTASGQDAVTVATDPQGDGLQLDDEYFGAGGEGIPILGQQPDGDWVRDRATGQLFATTVDLNAGETFTSDWYDTDGWSSLEVFVGSDETSAAEGVEIEFTDDVQATTPEVKASYVREYGGEAADAGFEIFKSETNLDGFRFQFTNNSTPVTGVDIIGTAKTDVSFDGANFVDNNPLGENFVRVGTDANAPGLKIGDPQSLFGDLTTIRRRTVIDLTSSFGTSTLRDETDSTGSGTISQDPDPATGEIVLSTGTTADSRIELTSAEYGRYVPGYSAQQGVGIRIPDLPTEGEAKWGYFNGNDGFYWGYDGDQGELFVAREKGGTEVTRVYRSNWNRGTIDTVLDTDWDIQDGSIFQIDYSWYGYGIILFTIVSQTSNDLRNTSPRQESVVVHAINVSDETSVTDPNQPIRVEAENGATGEDYDVRVGGRQYSVFGDQPSEQRDTAATIFSTTIADGAWTHIMSWRRDPDDDANARLNVDDIDFGIDQTVKLALVVNADVTGFTWGIPELVDPEETLLQYSPDGTFNGIGGGTKGWEGSLQVPGTGNAQAAISPDIDLQFGQNTVVSLVAQCDGGTGDATTTMRMLEDW